MTQVNLKYIILSLLTLEMKQKNKNNKNVSTAITFFATFAMSNDISNPEGPQPITTVLLSLNTEESL